MFPPPAKSQKPRTLKGAIAEMRARRYVAKKAKLAKPLKKEANRG